MSWWESFFDGPWQPMQRAAWTPEQVTHQVDAIERFCGLDSPSDILDVPCGTGRHSVELAARRHHVTGVDRTAAFLDTARTSAAERGVELTLEHRDMRDLPWTSAFDAAVCFWGSFGYFDDDGNYAFLAAVRRTLRPGGRFLIDTHCAETLLGRMDARRWDRVGEAFMLQETEWDHTTGRVETEWTFASAHGISSDRSSIRLYTYRELTELLEEAGFSSWEGYSTFDMDPFGPGASRLHMVATA